MSHHPLKERLLHSSSANNHASNNNSSAIVEDNEDEQQEFPFPTSPTNLSNEEEEEVFKEQQKEGNNNSSATNNNNTIGLNMIHEHMIQYYKYNKIKKYIYLLLKIITFYLIEIIFNERIKCYLKYDKTNNINESNYILIYKKNKYYFCKLKKINNLIIFEHLYNRYIYNNKLKQFIMIDNISPNILLKEYLNKYQLKGLNLNTHLYRLLLFGNNFIHIKPIKFINVILNECKNIFYLFQLFTILIYLLKNNFYYSFIHFICLITSFITALKIHPNSTTITKKLYKELSLSHEYTSEINVFRDGQYQMVGSSNLVPGDVVQLNHVNIIPADCLLLNGECQCDESTLTGDGQLANKIGYLNPIEKSEDDNYKENYVKNNDYILRDHNNKPLGNSLKNNLKNEVNAVVEEEKNIEQHHILLAGTKIEHRNNFLLALVLRTGNRTIKGKICTNILVNHLEQQQSNHIVDIYSLIYTLIYLSFISLIILGVYYSTSDYTKYIDKYGNSLHLKIDKTDIPLKLLYLFGITIPPYFTFIIVTLPLLLTNKLLYKNNIISTSNSINNNLFKFGLVDLICFDKTGTLVDTQLALISILEFNNNSINGNQSINQEEDLNFIKREKLTEMNETIITCLSSTSFNSKNDIIDKTCLEFTNYKLQQNNTLQNNNLQQNSLQNNFILHPPPMFNDRGIIQINKIYPFTSQLKRQSVLIKYPNIGLYCKGSPTVLKKYCKNIPNNYDDILTKYGLQGYKILAMAYKNIEDINLEINDINNRLEMEKDLIFLGFILFRNPIIENENEIFKLEKLNNIKTKMVTGDHIYSSIIIAKECGIVNYFTKNIYYSFINDNNQIEWKFLNLQNTLQNNTLQNNLTRNSFLQSFKNNDNLYNNCELCLTGDVFKTLRNQMLHDNRLISYYTQLLCKTHIYCDFSPNQKKELISDLKKYLNHVVCMTGDGNNDILAQYESDASLFINNNNNIKNNSKNRNISYAATFTCKNIKITTIISLAQLLLDKIQMNSKFLFIFIYLNYIVTCHDVIIFGNDISENMIIYINIFKGLLLSIGLSLNNKTENNSNFRPPKSIIRFYLIFTIMIQCFYQTFIFLIILFLLPSPFKEMDQTWIFQFINFQYLGIAFSLQLTYYFRTNTLFKSFYLSFKNIYFWLIFLILFILDIFILFPFPNKEGEIFIANLFDMVIINNDLFLGNYNLYILQKVIILGVLILNFFITTFIEIILMWIYKLFKSFRHAHFEHSFLIWKRCVGKDSGNYFTNEFK
ncbi:hypothetical protein ABK040_002556 [Willaertia magna]